MQIQSWTLHICGQHYSSLADYKSCNLHSSGISYFIKWFTPCAQWITQAFSLHPTLLLVSQVFWGQEHYSCLALIQEYLQSYLNNVTSQEEEDKEISIPSHLSVPHPSTSHHTEHSLDDLRTGVFRYIQDSGMLFLQYLWPEKERDTVKFILIWVCV